MHGGTCSKEHQRRNKIREKVLITGITGFAGSHLADYLLTLGMKVYGTIRWRSRTENIEHIRDKLELFDCDMRDASSVRNLIESIKPDKIFHLAAQSFVPTSWHSPCETLTTNIVGELNIFEAVRKCDFSPVIQIAGSSEEYGRVPARQMPIREDTPLFPSSPYGVSKVAQDLLARQYNESYRLKTVITRAFNHTGPRRGSPFVCSNFAKQIVEIEKGVKEPIIEVGNLKAARDFTDVRDMVRAYWLAICQCPYGTAYNICSGKAHSMEKVLKTLLSFSKIKIKTKEDPTRIRPSDIPVLLGDSGAFRAFTGWENEIPFEKTLQDLLKYWRERLNQ